MPTDRATIFFVTERPDDESLPLRGIYLTDIWHGQALHRRAIKELHSPVAKACWLNGKQLVRVMIQRLLTALASQNEAPDCELTTEVPDTDHLLLVIDFTSGQAQLADDVQPFLTASKLDCGTPEPDEDE